MDISVYNNIHLTTPCATCASPAASFQGVCYKGIKERLQSPVAWKAGLTPEGGMLGCSTCCFSPLRLSAPSAPVLCPSHWSHHFVEATGLHLFDIYFNWKNADFLVLFSVRSDEFASWKKGLFCIHIVVCLDQFQFLITSFTCTACIFPTESEARALAKERQKKDNHNLSK